MRPDRLPPSVTELQLTCLQAENCFIKTASGLDQIFPHQYPKKDQVDISTYSDSEEDASEEEGVTFSDGEGNQLTYEALVDQITPRLNTQMERMQPPTVSIFNQHEYGPKAWRKEDSQFNFDLHLPNLQRLYLKGKPQLSHNFLKCLPKSLTSLTLKGNNNFDQGFELPKHLKHMAEVNLKINEHVVASQPPLVPIMTKIAIALPKTLLSYSNSDRLVKISFLTFGSKDSILPENLPRCLRSLHIHSDLHLRTFTTSSSAASNNPWPESLTKMTLTGEGKTPKVWPQNLETLKLTGRSFSKPQSMHKLPKSLTSIQFTTDILQSWQSFLPYLPKQLKRLATNRPIPVDNLLLNGEPILPPSITEVSISGATPEDAVNVTKGLPKTIKQLSIQGSFDSLRLFHLPKSITKLRISSRQTVTHKLTRTLPQHLKVLSISCSHISAHFLEHLPVELEILEIFSTMRHYSPRTFLLLPRGLCKLTIPREPFNFELGTLDLPRGITEMSLLFPTYVSWDVAQRLPPSFGLYPYDKPIHKWRADPPPSGKSK
jgi:hypothetical protein